MKFESVVSIATSTISIGLISMALTACPGAAHDYQSGQVVGGSLQSQVLGLWHSACTPSEGGGATQAELNFLATNEMKERDLVFSDANCATLDQVKTDAANANKANMSHSFSVNGRGNRARGSMTINTTNGAKNKVESYSVAVIKNQFGEHLVMKPTVEGQPTISVTYDRVEAALN